MNKYLLYIILLLFSQASYADIDADIFVAKKAILKKGINREIKSEHQVPSNLENVDVARINKIAMKIMQDGVPNEDILMKLLSLIDQCLISGDKDVVKFSLITLSQLYFYNKYKNNTFNDIVGNDIYRKNIIIDHMRSDNEYIRKKSFDILALYFIDKEYVAPLVFERATNPIKESGFEKLHYFRTLGAALNNENTAIREFLVGEVMRAKGTSNYNSITVEAVHSLSKLTNPPEEIVLPTIEMLEGRYFGGTLLLETIRNYGALMKPYIERMRVLQKQVDKRILHGRDNKGKGSSTFTKRQYHNVLKELEGM